MEILDSHARYFRALWSESFTRFFFNDFPSRRISERNAAVPAGFLTHTRGNRVNAGSTEFSNILRASRRSRENASIRTVVLARRIERSAV